MDSFLIFILSILSIKIILNTEMKDNSLFFLIKLLQEDEEYIQFYQSSRETIYFVFAALHGMPSLPIGSKTVCFEYKLAA